LTFKIWRFKKAPPFLRFENENRNFFKKTQS
jgi:hypothetical protein